MNFLNSHVAATALFMAVACAPIVFAMAYEVRAAVREAREWRGIMKAVKAAKAAR